MAKHEQKNCPRCGKGFECKIGSIYQCQCWKVPLNDEERAFLKEKYEDCLCSECMVEEKHLYHQQQFEKQLKKLGNQFR